MFCIRTPVSSREVKLALVPAIVQRKARLFTVPSLSYRLNIGLVDAIVRPEDVILPVTSRVSAVSVPTMDNFLPVLSQAKLLSPVWLLELSQKEICPLEPV